MSFTETTIARWARLDELGPMDVHDLLKMRQDVFVLEQESLYQDIDGKDPEALHLLVRDTSSGQLVGTIRLLGEPEAASARIGRVVIAQAGRGGGLGRKMMLAGIDKARELVPACTIHVSAQAHLENFYNSLGFETVSDVYLEDGIPHVDMIRGESAPG